MSKTAYPYRVVTPPAGDPLFVTLEQARGYLRLLTEDVSDADLTAFIMAAQAATERFTRLILFTTGFETTRDFFQSEFLLRRAPLSSITSVERLISETPTTVATSVYKMIDYDVINFGSIVLKASQSWPSDQDAEARAIVIKFDAGFGADAAFLPPDLVGGMLRVLGDLYENRGDCSCSDLDKFSPAARTLLGPFKIMGI